MLTMNDLNSLNKIITKMEEQKKVIDYKLDMLRKRMEANIKANEEYDKQRALRKLQREQKAKLHAEAYALINSK